MRLIVFIAGFILMAFPPVGTILGAFLVVFAYYFM